MFDLSLVQNRPKTQTAKQEVENDINSHCAVALFIADYGFPMAAWRRSQGLNQTLEIENEPG